MSVTSRELPAPKHWQEFENLAFDIYRRMWKTNDAEMHGREGQPQAGVDVYGTDRVEGRFTGVQCKGKDGDLPTAVTEKELRAEVAKARTFQPPLEVFILATTGPNDQALQQVARQISADHAKIGLFEVRFTGWKTLRNLVADHQDVLLKYYSDLAPVDVAGQIAEISHQSAAGFEQTHKLMRTMIQTMSDVRGGSDDGDALAAQVSEISKLIGDGSPRAAIKALERLLAQEGEKASPLAKYRILAGLGNAHYALGDEERAISLFRQAFKAHPDYPNARATKALALALEGKREEAEPIATSAFKDDPSSARNASIWISTLAPGTPVADIEAALSPELMESGDIQHHLGLRARENGDSAAHLAYAEAALHIAPDDWRIMSSVGEALVQPLSALDALGITREIPEHLRGDIDRAIHLMQGAWAKLVEQDSSFQGQHVAANLISLLGMLGRDAEAEQILDQALSANPDYAAYGIFEARRQAANDDWAGAAQTLDNLPEGELPFDAFLLRTYAAFQMKDAEAAITWSNKLGAAERADVPPAERIELVKAMQVQAAILGGTERDAAIKAAIDENPNSIVIRSVLFDGLAQEDPLRARLVSEIETLAQSELSVRERMHAAETLYVAGHYSMAADLYEPLHQKDDNYALRRRLHALNLADRRAEARKLFETLPPDLRTSDGYLPVGVAIYERSGLLKPALALAERALQKLDVLRNRLIWIQLLIRLGRPGDFRNWLQKAPDDIEGAALELISLAQLVDRYLEDAPRALSFGYRALRDGYAQPGIHLAYALGLIIGGRSGNVTMVAPDRVEAGTGVVLINDATGEELHRIIETGPDPRVERDELSPVDGFAKRLLGLRVGETVEIAKLGTRPQVYRVSEIQTHVLFAFRRTMRQFPILFPDNSAFGSITIDDSKGDERFEEMFAMARARADRGKELETLYRDSVVPIPMFARFAGASVFEVWETFRHPKGLGLKVALGEEAEFASGRACADSGVMVVDPLSIYAWSRMGLGPIFSKLKDRLAVVQSTVDSLRHLIEEREGNRGRKSGTFGCDGDRYYLEELSEEAVTQQIAHAKEALELAEAFPVVAAESDQQLPQGVSDMLADLNPAYHDSLLAALAPKRALLTDDFGFRVVAQAGGASTTWTQAFVQQIGLVNRLTHPEYRQVVGGLMDAKYNFVQFSAAEIIGELQDSAWEVNDRLRDFAGHLTSQSLNKTSAAVVLAEAILEARRLVGSAKAAVFPKLLIEVATGMERAEQAHALLAMVQPAMRALQARVIIRVTLPRMLLHTTHLKPVDHLIAEPTRLASQDIDGFWTALRVAGLRTPAR
ncbi:hypothetical protein U5A82_04140 [Sphingobium sp. CR2-8]|uniref:PIN domain-containing protein n=1 Tax=Sphingobium sp. CR2-8 TaxID=1306534 RepID=UPI002DBD7CAF|nr:hypothetical protein [Sphingobium sp. CR2-8]MEC3909682.1 hypothetical protein [Sphingobium sp. CR2-8]